VTRRSLLVVDASAVATMLGPADPLGDWCAEAMLGRRLAAPRLMPFEAAGALRCLELRGLLDPTSATAAHRELLGLSIDSWPHTELAGRAWELRAAVSYADACYVGLAEKLNAPLLTLDRRLARAPGPRCAFLTPPEKE
jgi:predicted nucleic acid-binding protein